MVCREGVSGFGCVWVRKGVEEDDHVGTKSLCCPGQVHICITSERFWKVSRTWND